MGERGGDFRFCPAWLVLYDRLYRINKAVPDYYDTYYTTALLVVYRVSIFEFCFFYFYLKRLMCVMIGIRMPCGNAGSACAPPTPESETPPQLSATYVLNAAGRVVWVLASGHS